ncbi:ACT domain-containing protein [Clostridioides difficile]|nr:ACT domain-containing protein [Clostridioides difficile]
MEDKPGNFAELTRIISENGGNILSANQGKLSAGEALGKQSAEFILETIDYDHIARIKKAIEEKGFKIIEL